jgi:hypothetical protein
VAGGEVVVFQFGKGSLMEVLKPSISWQTMLRRSNKQSSKRCSSSRSPYHSHGISSAMPCRLPRGEPLDPRQPWSEVIPRFDPLIDIIEPVHDPQQSVGETPTRPR